MIPVNKMTFDNLYEATVAACAQAEYAMGGRFLVYQLKSNKYRVQYDSCKVRDGVDESDVLAEFGHIVILVQCLGRRQWKSHIGGCADD